MGKHLGYRVVETPGGKFRAFVRRGGKYASVTRDTSAAATAWAMAEAAAVLTGVRPQVALPDPSRRVSTADMAAIFLRAKEAQGRSTSHLQNMRGTLDRYAKAVPDLAADDAHRKTDAWVDALRITRVGKHRRKTPAKPMPGYRNRVIAELRAFCRWLVRKEYLQVDPSRTLDKADVGKRIKPQFTLDECARLLAFPSPDPVRQRRLALMLLAGLRSDEAAALTWADIQGGIIYVRKHEGHRLKRGIERLVPLVPLLERLLGPRGDPGSKVAPLPGVNSTVQHGRHFRAYLDAVGVSIEGRTPHSCRHTYAAVMLATGVPTLTLRAQMGHETVTTTEQYVRAAPLHRQAVEGWPIGSFFPD
jgi:integrase/recombinase XerD